MGLCGAVDTISAQAAGAQRLDLLGPIYRRSCLFLLCLGVWRLALNLFFLEPELIKKDWNWRNLQTFFVCKWWKTTGYDFDRILKGKDDVLAGTVDFPLRFFLVLLVNGWLLILFQFPWAETTIQKICLYKQWGWYNSTRLGSFYPYLLQSKSIIQFLRLHLPPFGLFCLSTLLWLPLLTDPLVAHSSSRFLLLLLPDLAAQCVWRPMNRVLASQRITCPFMVVSPGFDWVGCDEGGEGC